jgi:peptidyl-prolyl cis-trans isomerase C
MTVRHRSPLPVLLLAALMPGGLGLLGTGCADREGETPAEATPTPATAVPGAGAGTPGATPAPGQAQAAFDPSELPPIVARVDGKEVSRRELLERAEAMRVQMEQMGAPEPPQTEEFYREMLDQVIGAHLLYAEAARRELTPTREQVAAELATLRGRFPTEEAYRERLASQGMTEKDITEDLARNLAIQRLLLADVGDTQPTEAEERRFYQQNAERMKRSAQVRVRHILVGAPADAPAQQREAARREAESLLARVRAGEDFAELAGETSDDPGSRGQGGLLPWLGRGETVPPFEQAAFGLEPGQVSEVVESPFGYHVIRLEERRGESTVPFDEARPQIRELLERRESRDQLRAKVDSLRRQAKVEVLF